MKFKLEFDTDNAAFDGFPEEEIGEILVVLADSVRLASGATGGTIRDANGNSIGHWSWR